MALRRSERICNTLSTIGKDRFEDRIVIALSQKATDASFEQILEMSQRMARGFARCCEQGQNVGCLMDHRHALHEAICSTPSGSLPQSVAGCCNSPATAATGATGATAATAATADSALENRDRCFDNLQANATLSHSPFYSDAKLCSMRLRMPHRFLER
ncbi:serum albumin SDS-1-like [Lampetra fluviatilis]